MEILGYRTAKRVVEVGRSAFFPAHEPDLPEGRSIQLRGDDLVPQFGYIGAHYAGILLLGINPGNGAKDNIRSAEDARMMPALHRFAQNPTEQNYAQATQAYKNECQNWHVWRNHCAEVLGAGKLSFDQIAYTNGLPWRTESEARFSDEVAAKTAKLYVRPLLEELKPRLIVGMGKTRIPEILAMTGCALPRLILWTRARAATPAVKLERKAAAQEILRHVL